MTLTSGTNSIPSPGTKASTPAVTISLLLLLLGACDEQAVSVAPQQQGPSVAPTNPTPTKKAIDANATHEARLLKSNSRIVRLDNDTLTITLNSGNKLTLKNNISHRDDHISYRAIDVIEGRFVIVAKDQWECKDTISIVDLVSGTRVNTAGGLIASPDKTLLLSFYNDGFEQYCMGNHISLFRYNNNELLEIFNYREFDNWGPETARWLDDKTIAFEQDVYPNHPRAEAVLAYRYLKQYPEGWHFQPRPQALEQHALQQLLDSRKAPVMYHARKAVDLDGRAPPDILHFSLKEQPQGYIAKLELRTMAESLWQDEFTISKPEMDTMLTQENATSVAQWVEEYFKGALKFGGHYTSGQLAQKDLNNAALENFSRDRALDVEALKWQLLEQEKLTLFSYYRNHSTVVKLVYISKYNAFLNYTPKQNLNHDK